MEFFYLKNNPFNKKYILSKWKRNKW
jgi:hypothetical protein